MTSPAPVWPTPWPPSARPPSCSITWARRRPPTGSPRPSRPTSPSIRSGPLSLPPSPWATPSQKGSRPVPFTASEKIWMDGEFVDWDKAQIHVLTHSLHYGSGVFEGIRAYPTSAGVAVFRLTEHIQRLFASAKILMIDIPYSVDQLVEVAKEIVRLNGLDDGCYIR